MRSEGEARQDIVRYGRMLYRRRLLTGLSGNISARAAEGTMVITPSGACKGDLRGPELLALRILDGKVVGEGRPSMETPFHLACYRVRPDVGGVVHAHPMFCSLLAVSGRTVRTDLTPEGLLVLGEVALVPYETPGSEPLAHRLAMALPGHDAFILQNHGALTVGRDLADAYFKMEALEFAAELQVRGAGAGPPQALPASETKKVLAMSKQGGR